MRKEVRVRTGLDARKKNVCFRSWRLHCASAGLERKSKENQNSTWTQVQSWIQEFKQKNNESGILSITNSKVVFNLDDDGDGCLFPGLSLN